ncbi:unnamed protein product [Cuscuta epithymum]|uniref:Kinesin-like protein KIF22 n=1 Tax=Cuscuta epithymum TaxID=186058 RepID=A0AAV0E534_9ASTE|nr:unnamed protein product [Cuscuta epithymum]CAH9147698.1 unnamed protein product [Cuscuta epithymum]
MDSSTPDLRRLKLSAGSNPSRKVRIVGKVRNFSDQELGSLSNSKPWVTVHKPRDDDPSGKTSILFGEKGTSRKDTYELDYCYEQGEDDVLFSKEIKPAISHIFTGKSATVIAYGARGSGKTCTVQGLATSAICDILSRAEEVGKKVYISFFEVFQERAYDLLDPNQNEVHVFEDSQGRVKLRGLSQVPIKSISEFLDIYSCKETSSKQPQRTSVALLRRSHTGLSVNISSLEGNQNDKPMGVINFIDLAGYEDSRSSTKDGTALAESTRINRSLLSIMNVVFALNTNDSHVPYRENKLTRMLKDSLGGNNFTLMLACMKPLFCQDTIYTVSLASRACENIRIAIWNSTTKCHSSTNRDKQRVIPTSSVKKQNTGGHNLSLKRSTNLLNGRKLFSAGKATTSKKEKVPLDDSLASKSMHLQDSTFITESSLCKEEEVPLNNSTVTESEFLPEDTLSSIKSSLNKEEECPQEVKITSPTHRREALGLTGGQGGGIDIDEKENNSFNTNKDGSPLLSERLRALANNLKQLQAFTPPLGIQLPEGSHALALLDPVEPKTPVAENEFGVSDNKKLFMTKYYSPWEEFSENNTKVKASFARECIKFLNSASKDELKRLKGIGEKRATNILELRQESPEHFKTLEDLQEIGLSAKQVKRMVKTMATDLLV